MDELQRYGLLSLACLVVLCLALTFKDRETQRVDRDPKLAHARHAGLGGDELGKDPRGANKNGAPAIPEPHADAAGARPDDVPLRATGKTSIPATGANDAKPAADADRKTAPSSESRKPAAEAEPSSYRVNKGDTLRKIARTQLGDEKRWSEIASANPGLKENALKVGQALKLPPKAKPNAPSSGPSTGDVAADVANAKPEVAKAAPNKNAAPKPKPTSPRTHTVSKGETLSSIARRYYNDALAWKKIYNANKGRMKSATDVREGLVLSLP